MKILHSALRDRLGCQVLPAGTPSTALKLLEKNHGIGLIITDLHLPEVNGTELIVQIRENPRWSRIPIIVCTLDSSVDTVVECAGLGVEHFLRKPVDSSELNRKIRLALKNSPVKPPTQLEILLTLGIDLTTYQGFVAEVGQQLQGLIQSLDEKGGNRLARSEMKRLSRLLWPAIWKELSKTA